MTLLSSLGDTVEQACAAIRAGLTGFGDHPYYDVLTDDPEWDDEERLTASVVPIVDPYVDGRERLLELALPVLRGLVVKTRLQRRALPSTALLLSLPEDDAGTRELGLDVDFADELLHRAGLPGLPARPPHAAQQEGGFGQVRIDRSGHTSMLAMVAEARGMLERKEVRRAIALGVDSFSLEARLVAHDQDYRLKSTRARDGFVPGEAAVAMLLELAGPAASEGAPVLATLEGPTLGLEPEALAPAAGAVPSERSSSGRGLCDALGALLTDRSPDEAVSWVLCDLNGESYRAFEWGVVQTRMAKRFGGVESLVHPADCIGNVGAATGGVLVACAAHAFQRGYAPSDSAVVWTSAERGARAALRVLGPPATR